MGQSKTQWKGLFWVLFGIFVIWAIVEETLTIVATLTLNMTIIHLIGAMFTAFLLWGTFVAVMLSVLPDHIEKEPDNERR